MSIWPLGIRLTRIYTYCYTKLTYTNAPIMATNIPMTTEHNGKSSQNHLQTDRILEIVLLTFRCVWHCVYGTPTLVEFILVAYNLNTSVKWSTVFFTFQRFAHNTPLVVVVVVDVVIVIGSRDEEKGKRKKIEWTSGHWALCARFLWISSIFHWCVCMYVWVLVCINVNPFAKRNIHSFTYTYICTAFSSAYSSCSHIRTDISMAWNAKECLLFARHETKNPEKEKKKLNQTEKMERAVNRLKHAPFAHKFRT